MLHILPENTRESQWATHLMHPHTPRQCVFPLRTFVPISCFVLDCNWKASEGILGKHGHVVRGKASRQKVLKCISFNLFFFIYPLFLRQQLSVEWGSRAGALTTLRSVRGHPSSHITLWSLPTSVPDVLLVGTLKFNADESWLTSWEINVTHQPECSYSSGWRNLDLLLFLRGYGLLVDSCLLVCVCVW